MGKHVLKSVDFKRLKGLHDIKIEFSDKLTAIMGVNGIGKTTVIHALACVYQPDGNGENHKFPEFFIPNTDAMWAGSEFLVTNEIMDGTKTESKTYTYIKKDDRWAPHYANRPKRNVYYIGIDTCLPEIEKKTTMSKISYTSRDLSEKVDKKILEAAAYILNKPYSNLLDNIYNKKHLLGVKLKSGLQYSSLSMGTGEQRVLKILEKVIKAEQYSLILIDEIDLLLHTYALTRLVKKLYELSESKHLQIVFTTHSTEMISLSKYVAIQYINEFEQQMYVYNELTSDLLYSLTGRCEKKYTIFVEDELAKTIVNEIAIREDKFSSIDVVTYGSIENAFTLAASFVLTGKDDAKLIVIDGDKYITDDDRLVQIKKKLSGTESCIKERQEKAVLMIKQFILPKGDSPEKFLHTMICKFVPKGQLLYKMASEIHAVDDSHGWLDLIKERGFTIDKIIPEIFEYCYYESDMEEYVSQVKQWILNMVDRS